MGRARAAAEFVAAIHAQRAATAFAGYVRRDPVAQLALRPGRRDPYPIYARIRADGPMRPTRLGNWASARHDVCNSVLRDRRFGARPDGWRAGPGDLDVSFLEMNPPDHGRLRRLVTPAFSPRQVTGFAPLIERTVHELLGRAGDRFDLISALAAPLPVSVISGLLGVPDARRTEFARAGSVIATGLDGVRSVRHARALADANNQLTRLFEDLIALRRKEPADDVISTIVAADAETVRAAELVPLCMLLLIAGFETTVNLIGNAALALLGHPDQWRLVQADPRRAGDAVEETLRWNPPVQRTARHALTDVEVEGLPVRRGQVVLTLLGGANRDPAVYREPDLFDIERGHGADHLAFSSGIHYCLGQPLARLEATVAVRVLVERLPGLRIGGRVVQRDSTTFRGPLHLPVGVGAG